MPKLKNFDFDHHPLVIAIGIRKKLISCNADKRFIDRINQRIKEISAEVLEENRP